MNFAKTRDYSKPRLIEAGDLVIVYEKHNSLDYLFLGGAIDIYNNKFGSFHHSDIIGRHFGCKVHSRSSSGYVYILEPTPELWANALNTRTQIVNELDSSVILLNLDIHPGCTVVESGTGSGCLTLQLARAVHPSGHVFTYEYNFTRAEKASEEFVKLGVGHLVTVQHRDVCGKYFTARFEADGPADVAESGGFAGVSDKSADAVVLDLPEPWLALHHVVRVLKPGRSVCCYSPCMEQVMKTCERLRELKFRSIRTVEARQRPYDARTIELETIDLGLQPAEECSNNRSMRDKTNIHHKSKPKGPHTEPIFMSHSYSADFLSRAGILSTTSAETVDDSSSSKPDETTGDSSSCTKKRRCQKDGATSSIPGGDIGRAAMIEDPELPQLDSQSSRPVYHQNGLSDAQFLSLQSRIRNRPYSAVNGSYEMHLARPVSSMKGHTAFLTFASRPAETIAAPV